MAAIAVLALTVGWTPLAEADITRIVITRVESPTFEGVSCGAVGRYEKLVGRAFGEVDPHDPRNAVIVDIALAPRNARGMVAYIHGHLHSGAMRFSRTGRTEAPGGSTIDSAKYRPSLTDLSAQPAKAIDLDDKVWPAIPP